MIASKRKKMQYSDDQDEKYPYKKEKTRLYLVLPTIVPLAGQLLKRLQEKARTWLLLIRTVWRSMCEISQPKFPIPPSFHVMCRAMNNWTQLLPGLMRPLVV